MNTQHTPGPWKEFHREENSVGVCVAMIGKGTHVCSVPIADHEDEANARLIAAAPELLEALKRCSAKLESMANVFNGSNFTDRYADGPYMANLAFEANAIITKATAQTP